MPITIDWTTQINDIKKIQFSVGMYWDAKLIIYRNITRY